MLDSVDAALEPAIAALGLRTHVTDTIMADAAGRARLAADLLERAAAQPAPIVTESLRVAAIVPVATIEGAKTRLGETA